MWHTRALADAEVLFAEGEAASILARVVSGSVRLTRAGQSMGRAGPGAWLGEATAFVEGAHHFATAVAEGPTALQLLRRTELRSLRQSADPAYLELLIEAIGSLADRIDAVNADVLGRVVGGPPMPAGPGMLSQLWSRVTEAGGGAPDAVPILEGLPALTRGDSFAIARAGHARFVPTGKALVVEGDSSVGMYLVLSGGLRVVRSREDGGATELALARAGTLLGAHSTMRQQPRGATLVATEPTWVLEIALEHLPRGTRPAFAECLVAVLAAQLASANTLLMMVRGGHQTLPPETARLALGHVEAWQVPSSEPAAP